MLKHFAFILLFLPTTLFSQPYILVLGTAQDGGFPHIGCTKEHCAKAWQSNTKINVVSLALVDPDTKQWWLFEATPDIKEQLQLFGDITKGAYNYLPSGIFLTHAHIGHYTGLMQLGREALGAKNVPIYTLPKMGSFLRSNGPWSQLVKLGNINIKTIQPNSITGLTKQIKIKSFAVPHRDEFSETAGFTIVTPNKKYLFIPDINKWNKWEKSIIEEVKYVDAALLDATFYNEHELPNMRMSEVPHPYVQETVELFRQQNGTTKGKIHFIHFNHTNPLLWDEAAQNELKAKGYNVAHQGQKL